MAEGRDQLSAAVQATLGATRFMARGEQRAIGRALEPTERVLAVSGCAFEIVRHGAVVCSSRGAFAVVTDRRLLFARKVPFRPARIDEVARTELRAAATEVDAGDRRVTVVGKDIRITLRHVMGRDAVDAMAAGIGAPTRVVPDRVVELDPALPVPQPAGPLRPGSQLKLVPHHERRAYCIEQEDRVVAVLMRGPDGTASASLADRELRFHVHSLRRGWIGVATDERSGEQLASYRPGWGGTVTHEGESYRLRRGLTGNWRLKKGRTTLAAMRGGDPRGDLELAAGITDIADPMLLVVMIVWGGWLEAISDMQ